MKRLLLLLVPLLLLAGCAVYNEELRNDEWSVRTIQEKCDWGSAQYGYYIGYGEEHCFMSGRLSPKWRETTVWEVVIGQGAEKRRIVEAPFFNAPAPQIGQKWDYTGD